MAWFDEEDGDEGVEQAGIERLEVIDLTDPTGPDVDLMEMGENGCSTFVERVLKVAILSSGRRPDAQPA